jgi:hypothetical protein
VLVVVVALRITAAAVVVVRAGMTEWEGTALAPLLAYTTPG